MLREEIVKSIRQMAKANGGQPPGRRAFERETGIRTHEWLGVYWARWGDALVEAGFAANEFNPAMEEDAFFRKLVTSFRHYGRVPTEAEFRIYTKSNPDFPSHSTISSRFRSKAKLLERMREWAAERDDFSDVVTMLESRPAITSRAQAISSSEGFVYLIGSGNHFKIGRSDEVERRVKEIRIALPEAAKLVHAIRTDDPAGIEAYWHRRFADRRANGEWFKLTAQDIAAFKRRKYQ